MTEFHTMYCKSRTAISSSSIPNESSEACSTEPGAVVGKDQSERRYWDLVLNGHSGGAHPDAAFGVPSSQATGFEPRNGWYDSRGGPTASSLSLLYVTFELKAIHSAGESWFTVAQISLAARDVTLV